MRVAIWRSRLVGRGRTIGNRVTGNTVREFESLLLRHKEKGCVGLPTIKQVG